MSQSWKTNNYFDLPAAPVPPVWWAVENHDTTSSFLTGNTLGTQVVGSMSRREASPWYH